MGRNLLLLLALLLGCQGQGPDKGGSSPPPPPPVSAPEPAASEGVAVGALQADVQLDKEVYLPGEAMKVTVIATNLSGAFLTQEPADRKDPAPAASPYPTTVEAPPVLKAGVPGKYEVRLYGADNDVPLAVRAYEVKAP